MSLPRHGNRFFEVQADTWTVEGPLPAVSPTGGSLDVGRVEIRAIRVPSVSAGSRTITISAAREPKIEYQGPETTKAKTSPRPPG